MPCDEVQKALECEKQNATKLDTLKNFKEKLFSMAVEEHCQLRAHVQVTSMDSETKAEGQELTRPKTTTASAEIANISWQQVALLKEAIFNTVPGMAARTARILSSEEEETYLLGDVVYQPSLMPTTISGNQKVWLKEPAREVSSPMMGKSSPRNRDVLYQG